jgi:hypothetical protein
VLDSAPATSYDGPRRRFNLLLLVAANLVPLAAVLFFDWDVGALVVLYWSENLIIGFYNLLKMAGALGLRAVFPGVFFTLHYGGFCAVHGFFILNLLLGGASFGDDRPWPFFLIFLQLLLDVIDQVLAQAPREWLIAFVGLLVSHGYSFVSNFLLAGERERATARSLMAAPYKRIVILHVAIIAGGFAVVALGEPLLLLLVLVVGKTGLDIALHLKEHRPAPTD